LRLTRKQFEHFLPNTDGSIVLLEACGTAHLWGREAAALGHKPILLPAQFVRKYRLRNKTDRTDTEALIDAYRSGRVDPVPVRSIEQQQIAALTRDNEDVALVSQIPGIGLLTSTAMVACAGSPDHFKSGRHFSSWLGITPRECSSGNRRWLGRITKRGDKYLRMLLIHGARSVLSRARTLERSGKPLNRLQRWALRVEKRVGFNKATVAVANKLARTCWAVWKHRTSFDPGPALT
jgi:transposase